MTRRLEREGVLPAARTSSGGGILLAAKALLELIVVALFVMLFLVQPMRIPSESMVPTLLLGDCLLVDMQSFAPSGEMDRLLLPPAHLRRGDLVIFDHPMNASLDGLKDVQSLEAPELLVKRVIGLPGDRLRLRDGRVLLNGVPLAEPYAFYSDSRPNNFRDDFPSLREADPNVEPQWWIELRQIAPDGELTIPPQRYFVLGDNRNDSEDSRYWGFVQRDEIVGRPLLVYFSQRPPEESEGASLSRRLRDLVRQERRSLRILH